MSRGDGAILALDQGTTSSKAALFDRAGRAIGFGKARVHTRFGGAGSVHQDAEEIVSSQLLAIRRALAAAGHPEVAAVGVASQRSTFVIWDRATGRPLCPSPTWQSTEAADICASLASHAAEVRRRTGLYLSPHYSASKLVRGLRSHKGALRRARRGELLFGSVATFLIWRFTRGAVHAVDPTQAARTLLFNLKTLDWDPWLLDLFGVPRAMLPEIRDSLGDFGRMRLSRADVPIRACLGDQQAALYATAGEGGAARAPADAAAFANYGTGAFVLIPTGGKPKVREGLLTSLAFTAPAARRYLLEGTINAAGATLEWLRRELGAPRESDAIDALCRRAKGGTLLLASFWGIGSRAMADAAARQGPAPPLPTIALNLSREGTLAGLTRAAVESIAHQVFESIRHAYVAGRGPRRLIATGGLATLDYLMEYQASLLNLTVEVPTEKATREATLAGCAAAAAPVEWRVDRRRRPASRLVKPSRRLREVALRRHEEWLELDRMARRWSTAGEPRG